MKLSKEEWDKLEAKRWEYIRAHILASIKKVKEAKRKGEREIAWKE